MSTPGSGCPVRLAWQLPPAEPSPSYSPYSHLSKTQLELGRSFHFCVWPTVDVFVMNGSTILELPSRWQTTEDTQHATQTAHIRAKDQKQNLVHRDSLSTSLSSGTSDPFMASTVSLTNLSVISPNIDTTNEFHDLDRYIALGCLHLKESLPKGHDQVLETSWMEMLSVPEEVKLIIGDEAARLLDARWVRLFQHQPSHNYQPSRSVIRVYLLPEDWNRRLIDRNSKSLKLALRQLLTRIDVSPSAWAGDYREGKVRHFDPWASAEDVSLHYLFNKLASPAPDPTLIKSRYTRIAVRDLLKSASFSEWEEHGEQPLAGLRTRLYPYQARSASLMIQREAAPQLKLDPRLELRTSPNGRPFFFGARDGSYLLEPRFYEANRGGILAETMGMGKTIISLAVILATRGHYPRIPAAYLPSLPVRPRVGSLSDMAASIIGRHSIPARALIEQSELNDDADYTSLKDALSRNIPFYEIPSELPRLNRNTRIPPPRQLLTCSGTIIVVPRNLLHQWQSEIRKHVVEKGLNILVVDSVPKRGGKSKQKQQDVDTMTFASELPAPTELMRYVLESEITHRRLLILCLVFGQV
jgi:hypothetical protein